MKKTDYLIIHLDAITTKYVFEKRLFCGGCAYAAAIIARELEKENIPYEVFAYTRFNNPVESREPCAHLGVQVNFNGKKIFVGGEFHSPYWGKKVNLGQLPSEEILQYYKDVRNKKGWNNMYDVYNNSAFSRTCNNASKQFRLGFAGL